MALDLANLKAIAGASGLVIKKVIQRSDGKVLWQAGAIVSYVVDTGVSYTEEVSTGASCLAPKTFTPSKSGWTFVGWREDGTASSSVLSSKVMGSDPIVLYAVFKQEKTFTFISYNNTQTVKGTRYYNGSGNVADASITAPSGAAYSGWTWRGWSLAGKTDANASVGYANGGTISGLNSNSTYYGLYQKTCSAKFISYNSTQTPTGTAYYNGSGQVTQFTVTAPTGATYSGWTWRGWSGWYDTSANGSVAYANGASISIHPDNDGIPFYGLYQLTHTVTFVDWNGSAATNQYAYPVSYYNAAGNTKHSNATGAAGGAFNGYNFCGWSPENSTAIEARIGHGDPFEVSYSHTRYAVYSKTITLNYYQISNTTLQKQTGTQYVNVAGTWVHPKFSISPTGFGTEWTWRGWTTEANNPMAGVSYENISNTEFSSNITLYPLIYQVLCLSYNGNGATGGSVGSQWAWRTYTTSGSGNTDWPASFTLAANGFSRPDYNFTGWDLGAAGATVNIWGNTTVYAQWALAAKQLYPNGLLNNWHGDHPDGGISVTTLTCPDGGADVYEDNTGYGHSLVPVDLTNYTTLTIKYRTSAYFEYNSSVSASVLFYTNPYEFLTSVSSTALVFENNNATSRTITINVSNLNQSLYIGFRIYAICGSSGNTQSGILYIDDVKLT